MDAQSGDNLAWTFANYTPISVARPAPYTGSFQIYNIDPALRATINRVDRTAVPGSMSLGYTGFELAVTARVPGGVSLFGGWTFDKSTFDRCQDERDRGDDPNRLRFCDQSSYPLPYRHEMKFSASFPFSLPKVGSFNTGFVVLGIPGAGLGEAFRYSRSTAANNQTVYGAPFYTATTCVAPCVLGSRFVDPNVVQTLGTSPTQFDATILPDSSVKFFPRLTQVDANIAKVFKIGRMRYDVRLEAFNLMNNAADRLHFGVVPANNGGNAVTASGLGTTAGAQILTLYERASAVLDARVIRVAVTARF